MKLYHATYVKGSEKHAMIIHDYYKICCVLYTVLHFITPLSIIRSEVTFVLKFAMRWKMKKSCLKSVLVSF